MKSVWIVTTGSYSDYRIDSAWSTEALARRRVTLLNDGDCDVAEWDLDTLPCDRRHFFVKLQPGKGAYQCSGGDGEDYFRAWPRGLIMDDVYMSTPRDAIGTYFDNPKDMGGPSKLVPFFCTVVVAESDEHAKKIAREQLAVLVARGDWDKHLADRTGRNSPLPVYRQGFNVTATTTPSPRT